MVEWGNRPGSGNGKGGGDGRPTPAGGVVERGRDPYGFRPLRFFESQVASPKSQAGSASSFFLASCDLRLATQMLGNIAGLKTLSWLHSIQPSPAASAAAMLSRTCSGD